MKNKTNSNTINILKKFNESIKKTDIIEINSEPFTSEYIAKKVLLNIYKMDAFDILIKEGYSINPKEYEELIRRRNKLKKKGLEDLEINNQILKYENTLVYLIQIGCFENLKRFKDNFLFKLFSNFQKKYIDISQRKCTDTSPKNPRSRRPL